MYETSISAYCSTQTVNAQFSHRAGLLTSNTDTGSGTERKISPSRRLERSPSLRFEFVCIRSIKVMSAMKSIGIDLNSGAFRYENPRLSVRTTAAREEGVFVRETTIHWQNGIKSED